PGGPAEIKASRRAEGTEPAAGNAGDHQSGPGLGGRAGAGHGLVSAEPIPAFGGRTAETLVKSGKATAVRDYLDHLATGGYARGSGASASAPMIPAGPGARFRAPVRRSREGASTGRGWKRFISRFP